MARVLALVTHCESVCKHNGRGRSIGREFVRASAGRKCHVRTCMSELVLVVCMCMFRNVQLYRRYVGPNECIAPFGHGDQRDTDPWPTAKIGILSQYKRDSLDANSPRYHCLEFDRPFANVSRKLNLHFTSQEALTLALPRDPSTQCLLISHPYPISLSYCKMKKTLTQGNKNREIMTLQ